MRFNPMVAFMFEGCPADDTFTIPDDVQTAFRRGPMFRYFDCCMITNPRYQRFVLKCASEAGLVCQTSVREGGGTDGGPIHILDVPCVVAGVPSRYVHSGTALCTLYDVKMTAEVAVAVLAHDPRGRPRVLVGNATSDCSEAALRLRQLVDEAKTSSE